MKLSNNWMMNGVLLAVGTYCVVFAQSVVAQVKTTTSVQSGQSKEVVRVDRGTVVVVEGNDLVVRMEDGSIRHFENIPESAKITVDGKQLGIHDLKPDMKLQRTITTTTTPQTVTTIETVKGKVWYIAAPNTVILTLENGTNQSFKIPKGQKFKVDEQMVDAFGLRKGMVVTAIKIVEVPMSVVSQERSVTGTMPPPPVSSQAPTPAASQEPSASATTTASPPPTSTPVPVADAPLLIAEGSPTAAPPEAAETPAPPAKTNPVTGGYLPLVGLGLLVIIVLVVARSIRGKSKT